MKIDDLDPRQSGAGYGHGGPLLYFLAVSNDAAA
jgi:hypothetical protein